MAASYFYEKCNYDVTVIDSSKHPRLEFSASTTPYLKRFFKDIGIEKESEWMPSCKATYKTGVLYQDWVRKGTQWINTFEADEFYHLYWNKQRQEDNLSVEDFFKSRIYSSHISLNGEAKFIMNKDGELGYPYSPIKSYGGHPEPWAYHIDTGCFNTFLRNRYKDKVTLLDTEITEIKENKNGIESLITDRGDCITADLFIDCSGFKAVLTDKVNKDGKISLKPYLTHDMAVIMDVPYSDKHKEMKTATLTKALTTGWMWNICLYDRMINGYVYTSEYISDEDARNELIKETKQMFGEREYGEPWTVKIRTGHYARPWYKNVIALGVSAGFVEPMEATLLTSVQFNIINTKEVLDGNMSIDEFNNKYENTLMDTLDWISTQYYLSDRDDSEFWKFKARNKTQIRPRMQKWLESCKYTILPPEQDILFYPSCWYAKLIGSEEFPEGSGFVCGTEGDSLPSYSDSNFKPQNKFKYKEMDELNAKIQMNKVRNFNTDVLLSQKEYLDRFIYNVK